MAVDRNAFGPPCQAGPDAGYRNGSGQSAGVRATSQTAEAVRVGSGSFWTYPSGEDRGLTAGLEGLQLSCGELGGSGLPIPGEELVELLDVVIVDAIEHVGERSPRY